MGSARGRGIPLLTGRGDLDVRLPETEIWRSRRFDAEVPPEGRRSSSGLLKRLHTLEPDCRRYDPEAFAAEYSTGSALALGAVDRRRAAELREFARAYRARFPSVVLCHNDLVASNVLDDGGLKLVDFEYAVTAAPVLDIAGLAALNGFDKDERWRLAETYYDPAPVPFSARELHEVVRLIQLIAYFWALSSATAAGERAPYAAFAERAAAALETSRRPDRLIERIR